ncbi:MAG TPA: MBL fold metallo-hydrolase [Bacteroidales bacterium]|nr:MBL fold metallo-hydrolase [Bacteroidales bacterium]HOK74452.1 MBL fold metallo-hydrolase [Bacteroidales bacterium]HOM39721.1 MBL fold metallo-hydrolase [Bacteroidales bacterium]HOU30067.1 MBL fold metallo-hydrolase [Bacteroidales bacterium]HPP91997.1 MBL fold metallo-hydrolase [Bacteroidales bacterium]
MKITFLGTGTSQGVPVIACDCKTCQSDDPRDKRLRTSLLLETEKAIIVFDAGPDFRQQMLREKVTHIDAIVLTHEHKDHIAGMDDVRAFNYKTRDAIDIFAEERVLKEIRREYSYVFAEQQYPGIPKMRLNEINTENFSIKGLEIIPVRVMHFRLPILGFRIGDFAYITDANSVPEESKEKLYGVKYLVVNALRKEKHISHFSLYEAINFIREISPRQAYITHISHQMGLYRDVSKELPPEIKLAFDGLSIEIS